MDDATVIEIPTAAGPARAHVRVPDAPRGALVLGHGAGGGVGARDLVAAGGVALARGMALALVEQPYRVAGRRAPPRAPRLDEAWTAVVAHLVATDLGGVPLVTGGRSSGARVACRTAAATGSAGVLCLAFPVRPPARAGATPRPDRIPELDGVTVPVLVVQGERDPFGMPPPAPGRTVARIAGDHALSSDVVALRAAVDAWLAALLGEAPAG
ncbi:alpha/beta family hydrolase [Miltoncostaea oceani]|uniref:alpha/beta hydrolase family protein n=1 Tax=Miltoncostaea oceani TaxID=2843216 RepID=UPI001C3D785C|nr:alpha/beta family hydrolase [Miltoncostaea oceani]